MTAFIEYQFPPGISYGSSGGPEFNTTINTTKAGFETRQVNWTAARRKYNATYGIRNQADFDAVLALFHAVNGRATGFRFKDWSDFKSSGVSVAVGAADQTIGTGTGALATFQLVKKYTVLAQTFSRTIKKPVAGTVRISVDGVEKTITTQFTVDTTTGVVTFTAGNIPANGLLVKAGFEFDVPVRFDVDALSIVLSKPQLNQTDINLIEDMNA